MHNTPFTFLLGIVTLAACESSPRPSNTGASPPLNAPAPTQAGTAIGPPSGSAKSNSSSIPMGESVRVWTRGPGLFAIQNTTSQAVRIAREAIIESRDASGTFVAIPHDGVPGYQLSSICPEEDDTDRAKPLDRCVELRHGEILEPVPYQGYSCALQCKQSCRANVWEGPSTMRLRVSACDGSASYAGSSFVLPSTPEVFDRVQAAANLTAGEAWRLLPTQHVSLKAKPTEGTIAGYTKRAGTGVTLSDVDIKDLKQLITAPAGFNDQIRKRCGPPTHYVGFRLARTGSSAPDMPPTALPDDTSDLVFDFTCNAMFLTTGLRGKRVIATYFDPSRPGMLRFAKRLFPGDAEVQALREK